MLSATTVRNPCTPAPAGDVAAAPGRMGRRSGSRPSRSARCGALLLIPILACPALASPDDAALAARLDRCALRTRTQLERVCAIDPADRRTIETGLRRAVDASFAPVQVALQDCLRRFDADLGWRDAFSRATIQRRIDDARTQSGLSAAVGQIGTGVASGADAAAREVLAGKQSQVKQIVIDELCKPMPTPIDDDVLGKLEGDMKRFLTHKVDRHISIGDGIGSPSRVVLSGIAALIAGRVLCHIGPAVITGICERLALRTAAELPAAEAIGELGPTGWAVDGLLFAGGVAWEVARARCAVRDEVHQRLEQTFARDCRLAVEAEIPAMSSQLLAGLAEALSGMRECVNADLESHIVGIRLQAQSPDMAEYAAGKASCDVEEALSRVAQVFGRSCVLRPLRDKLDLVNRLGIDRARRNISRFGATFLNLFLRRPEYVAGVACQVDDTLIAHVMVSANPESELGVIWSVVHRLGTLGGAECRCLVLLRQADATLAPSRISGALLAEMAPCVGDLEALNACDSLLFLQMIHNRVTGSADVDVWRRAGRTKAARLALRVLLALGPSTYSQVVQDAGEDTVVRFADELGDAAIDMLRQDPHRALAVYRLAAGGGRRGVEIWRRIWWQRDGHVGEREFKLTLWALEHLPEANIAIDVALIEDLRCVHVDLWPLAMGRELGRSLLFVGLGPMMAISLTVVVGAIFLVVVAVRWRKKPSLERGRPRVGLRSGPV